MKAAHTDITKFLSNYNIKQETLADVNKLILLDDNAKSFCIAREATGIFKAYCGATITDFDLGVTKLYELGEALNAIGWTSKGRDFCELADNLRSQKSHYNSIYGNYGFAFTKNGVKQIKLVRMVPPLTQNNIDENELVADKYSELRKFTANMPKPHRKFLQQTVFADNYWMLADIQCSINLETDGQSDNKIYLENNYNLNSEIGFHSHVRTVSSNLGQSYPTLSTLMMEEEVIQAKLSGTYQVEFDYIAYEATNDNFAVKFGYSFHNAQNILSSYISTFLKFIISSYDLPNEQISFWDETIQSAFSNNLVLEMYCVTKNITGENEISFYFSHPDYNFSIESSN